MQTIFFIFSPYLLIAFTVFSINQILLKVEANPEFYLEISIGSRAERIGDIRNLESFHKFQVNGNTEEEELKLLGESSDGICFTKEREEFPFIVSLKIAIIYVSA
jgi:hypothetical protein